MLLSRAKSIFELKIKTTGGLQAPNDADLSEIFYEALIYVATKCIPRELLTLVTSTENRDVLRLIGGGSFIALPQKPNFLNVEPLQIDSDLDYAVINKAAALYSREKNDIIKFENEASRVINRYKANFNKVKQAIL